MWGPAFNIYMHIRSVLNSDKQTHFLTYFLSFSILHCTLKRILFQTNSSIWIYFILITKTCFQQQCYRDYVLCLQLLCFVVFFVVTCLSKPAARFDFCLCYIRFVVVCCCFSGEPNENQGRGLVGHKLVQAPSVSLLAVPRRLFCFGFLVILDVACCYLWLFLLYINIKIGKNSCTMSD